MATPRIRVVYQSKFVETKSGYECFVKDGAYLENYKFTFHDCGTWELVKDTIGPRGGHTWKTLFVCTCRLINA